MLLLVGTTNIVPFFIEDALVPGAQDASLSAINVHKNSGAHILRRTQSGSRDGINPFNDRGAAGVMRVQASALWHLRGFDATAEVVNGPLREQYKPRKGCE
jgi:hypothetical protein